MSLYENRLYQQLKKIYFSIIEVVFGATGMPIKINGFALRFYPRHYKWFPKNYEAESFEFIKNNIKQNWVCIDIGAHFGLYSLVLAKFFNCRVHSFEPTAYTASVFSKNIHLNHVEDMIIFHQKAVSDKNGTATFLVQDTNGSVANSLVNYWHSNESKKQVTVDVVSIDSQFKNLPYNFIKIDAEGAEYGVLIGASQTIREFQPLIMLGLHPNAVIANGHSLELIWEWIVAQGYSCRYKGKGMEKNIFCSQVELFDVFLMPKQYQ
jgi:FkbM family methyltransferase